MKNFRLILGAPFTKFIIRWVPDFIVDDKILIEIKGVPNMPKLFDMQLYYYLKGTKFEVGFLVNFGSEKIQIKRRIQDNPLNP